MDFKSWLQSLGRKLHVINVRLPWLKVVGLLLVMTGVIWGTEEIIRSNISRTVAENSAEVLAEGTVATEVESPESPAVERPVASPEPAQPERPTESPGSSQAEEPSPIPPQVTGRKLVALTFDDGPSPVQTPRLLEILAAKKVRATFFVLGNMVQKAPEVLKSEAASGHEVGSHTMTHANLKKSSVESIKWEVAAMNETFRNILGVEPKLLRPPYGNINDNVRAYTGQPLILWTVDPEDWKYKDAATVRSKAVAGAFDGAVILLHDIHSTTVDAVSGIIDDLRAAGYEFMTVSELAAARGVDLAAGRSYGSFRP